MNRIPAQNPRQPGADLPAGRHNHLIVVAATGLGAHRPYQTLTTDEAPRLAADCPQVPHRAVLAMLSHSYVQAQPDGTQEIP
jgi:hypothetical protein